MNEITYRPEGDYLIPNIGVPALQEHISLGKYGRMHRQVLLENILMDWSL